MRWKTVRGVPSFLLFPAGEKLERKVLEIRELGDESGLSVVKVAFKREKRGG